MPLVIELLVKDKPELDSSRDLITPLWLPVLQTRTKVPLECSEKAWNTLSGLLPYLPTPFILKARGKDHGNNVVVFCAGARLYLGAKQRTYGVLRHDICSIGKKRYVQ